MSDRESDRKMTKKVILEQCKRNKLYMTPQLNDVLYLHFQGFPKIENLDEFIGLKCLWLESNAISKIEGLESQPKLKSLFLQNNLISKIENLEYCKELDTLVLSHNYIKSIENCCSNVLPVLNTLNISHNQLKDLDGLEILSHCYNISILDLSYNKIDDMMVVKVLGAMPMLHVLTMTGNPVVSTISNYRKTMILECKSLTYLDSRPVFPRDRACAEAWKCGGFAAEKREHEQWNREERRKIRKSVSSLLMKTRGQTLVGSSSEDDGEEEQVGGGDDKEISIQARNEESNMEIYEGHQKELIQLYESDQKELEAHTVDISQTKPKLPTLLNRTTMIEMVKNEEKIEQHKDDLTKMLDISSDQDKILQMLQMNKSIEENIFGIKEKQNEPKKVLIEEIVEEAQKNSQQKVSFKIDIEEIPMLNDDEMSTNEMESMLWFEDESTTMTQNFESLEYQLTNLPDIVSETFAEDYPSGPDSIVNPEDFAKVLEMCSEQKTDAMQLCFLNENEKLMQIYDEAVEQQLVMESDGEQLAEIDKIFHDDDAIEEGQETFPNLDGILTIKKLDIIESSSDVETDDIELLQFSHIEISEAQKTAENLIDGVIKSLEDIEIPL